MTRSAASSVDTRWRFASLVTACRTFSSIEPVTSPPCTWTTGMFMYDAADRRGQRLVPVGNRHHGVRLEVVEHRGELDEPQAGRLGRRHQVLALEHHVDARGDREAVPLDRLDRVAVAIEQRGRGDDELQLEVRDAP